VSFKDGSVLAGNKGSTGYDEDVRCVRGGQYGYYDPIPADAYTQLVADEDANNNCNGSNCIPLILIHGVHGNEINGVDNLSNLNRDYWINLLNFLYNNGLNSKYKIYRFHYVSDMYSVWEIARSLRNKLDFAIDSKQINDVPFVIVAHSMGGLVTRSYMEEHSHRTGFYGGVNHSDGMRGGERILKLITLATPHHGTPGENDTSALDQFFTDGTWGNTFGAIQWLYHFSNGGVYSGTLLNSDQPNRSDLRWDNYDGATLNLTSDVNIWLKNLNQNVTYDSKIIAYYGI
jgi:triacylglycerol esterase/lipase EstA (alpha/beta hydrolase family)